MGESIKVLIVDDHTLFRQGLRKLLEAYAGVQVIGEASNGKEAIAKVDEISPDLVLMDIKMPRMDGIEAIRFIKEKHPELNILALSMYEDAEYVLKAVNAGANGYMQKNISADRLVDAIQQLHEGNKSPVYLAVDSKILQEVISGAGVGKDKILSSQEKEVLRLMADGNSNKQIADRLFVSDQTVKGYIHNIFRKLGASGRAQAVAIALKEGLL